MCLLLRTNNAIHRSEPEGRALWLDLSLSGTAHSPEEEKTDHALYRHSVKGVQCLTGCRLFGVFLVLAGTGSAPFIAQQDVDRERAIMVRSLLSHNKIAWNTESSRLCIFKELALVIFINCDNRSMGERLRYLSLDESAGRQQTRDRGRLPQQLLQRCQQ